MIIKIMGVNFRILEIHIFYNCGLFYWHLIEILWLFIFLVFYYSGFNVYQKHFIWLLLSSLGNYQSKATPDNGARAFSLTHFP